jgi:protein-S-isoprenylcysteine O-methyltransferase Ste14
LSKSPSLVKHFRDILILPFTVTVVVPYLIYNPLEHLLPEILIVKIAGVLIALSGFSLFVYTISLFRKIGKGTLAPWTPTQKLVVDGPYQYCRNPMITGVFSILIGESLILQSASILIWSGIFFLINTAYFLLKEEPDLYKRFGEDYLEYKRNVPRWIPRLTPFHRN